MYVHTYISSSFLVVMLDMLLLQCCHQMQYKWVFFQQGLETMCHQLLTLHTLVYVVRACQIHTHCMYVHVHLCVLYVCKGMCHGITSLLFGYIASHHLTY